MKHDLIMEEYPYFSTPMVYVAICSCGRYESGNRTSRIDAEKSWLEHKRAKESPHDS